MDLPQTQVCESKKPICFTKIERQPAMCHIVPCSIRCILPAYRIGRLKTVYMMGRVK